MKKNKLTVIIFSALLVAAYTIDKSGDIKKITTEPETTTHGHVVMIDLTESSKNLEGKRQVANPTIYKLNSPVAGNYPQGLFKYPYRQGTTISEVFNQTLVWEPEIIKTFDTNTEYTAILTLVPDDEHTFIGVTLSDVRGLPEEGVTSVTAQTKEDNLVLTIVFHKTAAKNADPELIFFDEFEGNRLDMTKWNLCPNWDRQGRSSWQDDMVSVSDGYLNIRLMKDPQLGAQKSSNTSIANNWIRAGGIRSKPKDGNTILFENSFGYYEARIKFPKVSGTWGAFWLMSPSHHLNIQDQGQNGTEIDIVETISNHQNSFSAALHWNGYAANHLSVGSGSVTIPSVNIYDGEFHTFALCWSPTEYIFYVDGQVFWRVDGGSRFKNSGINQNPNYIKLTVESANWSVALPIDFEESVMLVDYVRIYNQPMIKE